MAAGPHNENWLWTVDLKECLSHTVGELVYLFHKPSGTTHILNSVSLALVDFLASEPRRYQDVAEQFHSLLDVPSDECPPGVARRLFQELDDAGLVKRVQP